MGLRTTTDQRYFVYDGDQMVLVMDAGGAVQNRYLWGAAVDEILADEQVGGELLWTLTDNLGTVRELVNNTSTVRKHIAYDTYGNVLSETAGGARSAIKFTGRYFDTETGLQWNLNRWYDAKTGRWLSQDPIGFEGGDGNLYRYVGNDPGNYVDPDGLAKWSVGQKLEEMIEAIRGLPSQMRGLSKVEIGLVLDIFQLGLDIGGIFEPTPFCDIGSGLISASRGDWFGVGTSALGMLPYVGDAGKALRIPKYVQSALTAIELAAKNERFAQVARPALRHLHDLLSNLPLDNACRFLPDEAGHSVRGLKKKLDDFFNQPVKPGDRGGYGDLKTQKRDYGETEPLDIDHRPSYAAQKKALEDKLGRKLTYAEAEALKNNTPAVATPRATHQQKSRTYGGRNTQKQIAEDAKDLEKALRLDEQAYGR